MDGGMEPLIKLRNTLNLNRKNTVYMKRSSYIVICMWALVAVASSCSKQNKPHRSPGRIYAPDMTYSQAYETYAENPVYANKMANRELVEGTVARGDMGYPEFKAEDSVTVFALSNPLSMTEDNLKEGKRLFNIYCAPCHGVGLDGNGPLYASGKYPLAPANLKGEAVAAFTQGKLYYTILFGKNMMGSYASQLTEEQRWLVVGYINNTNHGSTGATPDTDAESGTEATTTDTETNTETETSEQ